MSLNVPPDDELKAELLTLRSENPTLGVIKTHALLLSTHPGWAVSEKRLRKVLKEVGSVDAKTALRESEGVNAPVYPSSRVIDKLDVGKWTNKVEVRYFDRFKGKGLIAKERIEEREVIWKEDPFVVAPEWKIYNLQQDSTACGYCTTPFPSVATPLITNCPFSCTMRFCNRLCLARSAKTHPLLCPVQNPASVPLIAFAKQLGWLGLHALAQCTSKLLLARQISEEAVEDEWRIVKGFAMLGMEERFKGATWSSGGSGPETDRDVWKKTHQLYLQAFSEPTTIVEKKKLAKILKKPLKQEMLDELFTYEGFLRGLGRMSLNVEAHGGVYTLHSHLNHSCHPNVSVRHLDQHTHSALSRITLIARTSIEAGEELLISYVDPSLSLMERREELKRWNFGECKCDRCMTEEKVLREVTTSSGGSEMRDLEKELKAGLGIM